MASEQLSGTRAPSKPTPPKPPPSAVQPSPPGGTPLHNDGLELLRDTNT